MLRGVDVRRNVLLDGLGGGGGVYEYMLLSGGVRNLQNKGDESGHVSRSVI